MISNFENWSNQVYHSCIIYGWNPIYTVQKTEIYIASFLYGFAEIYPFYNISDFPKMLNV